MSKEQKTLKSCYILDRLREWFELYGNQNHQRAEEELHLAIDELYEYQQKDHLIADLETKLAEKEKEIKKLNACVVFYKSYYVSFQEKVIDELERVKEKILPEISSYVKKEFVVKEFDNQIKQLKGRK